MFPPLGWPLAPVELQFLRALIEDLRPLGFDLALSAEEVQLTQRVPAKIDSRDFYRSAHAILHRRHIDSKRDMILQFEKKHGSSIFISGSEIDLNKIEPRLRELNTQSQEESARRDAAIVEYIRSYQTVESRMSVGRENVFLLEDHGQQSLRVMGLLVLSSPRYYQSRRDQVMGWASPTQLNGMEEDARKRLVQIRMAGLNRIMHISVCCALPPYSQLGAAKLLALAPFVDYVRAAFSARWRSDDRNPDPDLVAVTTTTSMGLTGTPFQALSVSKFFDDQTSPARGEKWNHDGSLYSRLTTSHPWEAGVSIRGGDIFSDFRGLLSIETTHLARQIIDPAGVQGQSEIHYVNQALARIGVSRKIFRGNPRGVFMGAIDRHSLKALQDGRPRSSRPVLSWDLAVQGFRQSFGAEIDKKIGPPDRERRERAIAQRRERATSVALKDILLSTHMG